MKDQAFRLFGTIQNYAWGGYSFIPLLISQRPVPGMPYAEYWMGAHEKAPSDVLLADGTLRHMDAWIAGQPEHILGPEIARKYGRLPFLLKILDVREMLSVQVHPAKQEAEAGFARENALGIPRDAPERNYKDDNHKPELQVALSDFWLLHGFRPQDQLREILQQVPEFSALLPLFTRCGHLGLYTYVMEMPARQVSTMLAPLAKRILQQYAHGVLERSSPDFWAAQAIRDTQGTYDRGIFSIYFFNLLRLRPGQAIFQDAGVPHAALSGQALEIMANSDNVIRGGLTPKHIDVPQLLHLISCDGLAPKIVEGTPGPIPYEARYESAAPDFCLHRIQIPGEQTYETTTYSAEIILTMDGSVLLECAGTDILLKKGQSAFLCAGKNYRLRGRTEETVVYRASLPASR